jgi:hypothetical protein
MTAPSAATDKGGSKVVFDPGSMTSDALIAAKNVMAQFIITWPGMTPDHHKAFWFVGSSVPDGTDYPDSVAPIGSLFLRIIVTSGAVSGALLYLKTAAATWTAQS